MAMNAQEEFPFQQSSVVNQKKVCRVEGCKFAVPLDLELCSTGVSILEGGKAVVKNQVIRRSALIFLFSPPTYDYECPSIHSHRLYRADRQVRNMDVRLRRRLVARRQADRWSCGCSAIAP